MSNVCRQVPLYIECMSIHYIQCICIGSVEYFWCIISLVGCSGDFHFIFALCMLKMVKFLAKSFSQVNSMFSVYT